LKVYNIEPETFINRYHKYVDGVDTNSISIEDIKDFLRFAGKVDEHSKVLRVLRISQKRLDNLKNRFETKLIEPMKRIMRHDTTDATHAGLHFPASGKRYNAMLINALQKAEKVKTLKEKGEI
jgi:type II secretory pathway predicted ATPase ExeA